MFNKGNVRVLSVEKAIEIAGNGHSYQLRTLILFSVQWLFASIIFYGRKFFFIQPDIYCSSATESSFLCTETQACSGDYTYEFDPNGPNTLVKEFDLICENAYFINLFAAAFFMGSATGAYYWTDVQQAKGRLYTLIQTTTLVGFVMMASILSFNIYINIAAIFLAGFGLFGFMNASIVYYVEISSENLRVLGPNLFLVAWALGEVLLSTVLQLVSNWRPLAFIFMGAPMAIAALFYRFMKESPRYLVLQEKFDEAKTSIQNIAKINQRTLMEFAFENEMKLGYTTNNFFYQTQQTPEEKTKQKTVMTLCKYPALRTPTWVILVFWILFTIGNHGTVLALKHFNDSAQESLLTVGVVELFGYIIAGYCCLNFRRKSILRFAFIVGGFVYIIFALVNQRPGDIDIDTAGGMMVLLLVLGRGAVCIGIGTMYVYITEVYPTSVRHFGFGFFTASSYLALIFVMNMVEPLRDIGLRPSFLVGVAYIGMIWMLKYVPETQKNKLVDYINEEDDLLLNKQHIEMI